MRERLRTWQASWGGDFSRAVAGFVGLNVAVKLAWVVADNLLQDRYGHAAYGRFAALLQLTLLGTAVFDVMATPLLVRRLAKAAASEREALLGSAVQLRLALTAVYLLAVAGLAWALGYEPRELPLIASLAVSAAVLNWLALVRGILQAEQRWRLDAWASVADKGLLLIALPLVIVFFDSTLGVAMAMLLTGGVALLAFTSLLRLKMTTGSAAPRRQLIEESLPLVSLALLLAVIEKAGQVAVERLASPAEAGLYAGAFRWTSAALMGVYLLQPWFYARFSAGSEAENEHLIRRGMALFATLMALPAAVFVGYPEVVLVLFRHSDAAELAAMAHHLRWQGPALWLTGLLVLLGTRSTAAGSLWQLVISLGVVCVGYLALLMALVPHMGGAVASPLLAGAWLAQGLAYVITYRERWRPGDLAGWLTRVALLTGWVIALALGLRLAQVGPWVGLPLLAGVGLSVGLLLKRASERADLR